jgi:outer membrane protein
VSALTLLLVLGSTPITLQEVRELSRRNVPALLAELSREQASEQVRISRSAIFPQVNLRSDASRTQNGPRRAIQPYFNNAFDPVTGAPIIEQRVSSTPGQVSHNYDLIASLQQLLFDGGRWWNQIAQSGAQQEAADGQFREQQLTSEFEGARRFYSLFGAQRTLDVLNDNVKRSKDQLDRANALYEAGRGTKSDAIQAVVNLGNDRIAAVKQQASIAGAQSDLAVWVAHPGAEDLVAQDPGTITGPPRGPPAFDDATKTASERRPLLKALSDQVRAAEYGIAVARAGFFPKLSANVAYSRTGNTVDPVFTDPSLNNNFTIGLALSWDLFSGFATSAQTGQANYSKFSADLNLADARRQLEGDIRRNLRSVEVQIDAAKIAEENRRAAADGLVLAQERFTAGLANTLEVRDAQLKLTQADLSLLQTRIDLEVAREALLRTIGGPPEGAAK